MARRGFFAEMHHQQVIVAKQQQAASVAAQHRAIAAARAAEAAAKSAERARAASARTAEAERKHAEAEAKRLHIAAGEAQAAQLNAELQLRCDELDNLLAATLEVDDFVDLETLRRKAVHPPFARKDLEQVTVAPPAIVAAPAPVFVAPAAPSGLAGMFAKKGRHAAEVAEATLAHEAAMEQWRQGVAEIPAHEARNRAMYDDAERSRLAALASARASYASEREGREAEVAAHNASLDALIAALGYGAPEAVEEYISIVLNNSVYPDDFEVRFTFAFVPDQAELELHVLIPGPDALPSAKAYRYNKPADTITCSELSAKERRDRYEAVVHQMALRAVHEMFDADRRGLIRSISLKLGTETIAPATGRLTHVPFVALAAGRESFLQIDLGKAVPAAALKHLGATVAKNPAELGAIESAGVRKAS